ncbi:hypothetical protein I312_100592 [Cryptococcus bacillisporus CA1280]|uniref:uncharacterized protein n=1 Tax=Cryptococcus bacillisporus CA1280 TaxID=1296109 RepID=UPI0033663C98
MHEIAWAVAVYVAQEGGKGASTDKRVALIRCVREDAAKRKARFTPFHNPFPDSARSLPSIITTPKVYELTELTSSTAI